MNYPEESRRRALSSYAPDVWTPRHKRAPAACSRSAPPLLPASEPLLMVAQSTPALVVAAGQSPTSCTSPRSAPRSPLRACVALPPDVSTRSAFPRPVLRDPSRGPPLPRSWFRSFASATSGLFNKGPPAGEGVGSPSSTPLLGAVPPGTPYFVKPRLEQRDKPVDRTWRAIGPFSTTGVASGRQAALATRRSAPRAASRPQGRSPLLAVG
jgi:hypothetical protein